MRLFLFFLAASLSNFAFANTAAFQQFDTTTHGNWKGIYGQGGYIIANDSNNPAAYSTVTSSGATPFTWLSSTADQRALLKGSSATDRIVSAFYTFTNLTFDLNLTDGQPHKIAIYCLDFDNGNRSQKISIYDAASGALLSSQSISNFVNGAYAVWTLQGHVSVQITYTGGLNAVVNGIFFDGGGAGSGSTPAPPTVSISSPAAGPVSGTITASAAASSSASIANVQFKLDGASLGAAVSSPPFTTQWNTANSSNGSHALTAVATDSLGQTATSNAVTVTVANSAQGALSSTFVKFDSTTQGAWKGVYGADGYLIANDSTVPPSYTTSTFTGAGLYTWNPSTTDPRALLKGAAVTDRISSTYFAATSFTFELNFTDGQAHQVAVYALDWDTLTRAETISIVNADTNAVLDSRAITNFYNGVYAIWNLQGHVKVQVTCTSGLNAVISGIFFGGAGATQTVYAPPSVTLSSPTAGSTVSSSTSVTATATAPAGIASLQFLLDGSNLGAGQSGSGPSFSTTWSTTGSSNGSHSLSAIATDTLGQHTASPSVTVTVANSAPSSATANFAKFDSTTLGNWKGVYGQDGYIIANDSNAPPSYATVTMAGAASYTWAASSVDQRALLKGASATDRLIAAYYTSSVMTFDVNLTGSSHQLALYSLDVDSTSRLQTVAILDASTNAVLDTQNIANFHNGIYAIWNVQGHVLVRVTYTGGLNAVVSGLFFGAGGTGPVSAPTPTAPTVSISSPSANASVSGSVAISATASAPAGLSSVQFQVDGSNLGAPTTGGGPTFGTTWSATAGPHTLTAIATDTLGQHTTSAPIAVTATSAPSAKSTFIGFDRATQGSWKGVYGQSGYYIPNDSVVAPSFGSVTPSGATSYTWSPSLSDPRALLKGASSTDRIASTYYGASFYLDVNFTDGQSHEIALYFLDYDGLGRSESVSIVDAASNAVLDSQTISGFYGGIYAAWNVQGHVLIQIRLLGGLNSLVNGVFLGPPVVPPALQLSTTALTYSSVTGAANPPAQSIAISNAGSGTLNWAATKTQNWLTLSSSGGVGAGSVSATVNTSGLGIGVYTDTITIAAANASGSPQTIAVTLNLTAPAPVLSISTSSLSFAGISGDLSESSQSVAVTNANPGALNWSATHTQPWLTLSASSGAAPGALSVNVNLTGLNAGSYADTITISSTGAQSSPQTVTVSLHVTAPPSLVANWTFEPATINGNSVADTSGNNLYATITGNVTPIPGKVGQALNFDGVTGYLRTQPTSLPAMAGDLTLAMWIRTTNASRTESIISKYDLSGSEDGYIVETNAAGYLALQFGGADIQGNALIVDGVHRINDGQWHHIAVIIRAGQDVSFYVDGGLSSIDYLTTTQGAFTPPVTIGGAVVSHSYAFTGAIDETRIYNRALTTAEITSLFGAAVTTAAGGQTLYNGIAMPLNFPPPTFPTQVQSTPYYINNPPRVIPIDLGRQLFVDDFLIEQTNLVRTQHQASVYPNPVLTPGAPISDGLFYNPATRQYQLWFYNSNAPNSSQYAYSLDGKSWTEPAIPDAIVPNSDIIFNGGMDTVWLDLQETDPGRRYKAFQVDPGAGKVYVYFSADGIHWSARQAYDINSISDRTTFFWNPFRSVWVNSDRGTAGLSATALEGAFPKRARFYSESKDLVTWTPANPQNTYWTGADDHDPPYYLNNPGGQPPELYTLDCNAYESVLVGMFSWFYPGVGYSSYTLPGPILTELGVGFSRDGFSWVRPTRGSGPTGAFIPASNTPGTWNAYNTQSVGGSFLVVGNEIWFYFSARTLQKPADGTFSTGLATLRRDGFYSMDAQGSQATLITHPLKFSGSHFFVNVNDPSGQLLVEVLDSNGNVIPGFAAANATPITANTTLQEVTWSGGNIASLAGQNVKFKFYLTNGSLYSFWVTPNAQGASYGYVGAGGPGFSGVTDTIGSGAYLPGQH